MPIVRTCFRPWEDVEVSEEEAAAMERMGLLSNIVLGEPEVTVASTTADATETPEQDPAPKPRRTKTADTPTAPVEEVKTDGSSEEGGGQEGSTEEG